MRANVQGERVCVGVGEHASEHVGECAGERV
jgi:hypothetical protein